MLSLLDVALRPRTRCIGGVTFSPDRIPAAELARLGIAKALDNDLCICYRSCNGNDMECRLQGRWRSRFRARRC